MAKLSSVCLFCRLHLVLFQFHAALAVTVYKEDCPTLDGVLNVTDVSISDLTGMKVTEEDKVNPIFCGSFLDTLSKVCHKQEQKLFYVSCNVGRQLSTTFQALGIKYGKHEFHPECLDSTLGRDSIWSRLDYVVLFFRDMMTHIGWDKMVLITDMETSAMQRELAKYYMSVAILSPSYIYNNFSIVNFQGSHFFVFCTPATTRKILKSAQKQNFLISPQTWVIMADIEKETLLQDIHIPYNSRVIVATSSIKSVSVMPHYGAIVWTHESLSIDCGSLRPAETQKNTAVDQPERSDHTFLFDLYEVYAVLVDTPTEYRYLGKWSSINMKRLDLKYSFPNMLRKLNDVKLNVVLVKTPPYIIINPKTNALEGFYGLLFNALAEEMNFTYNVTEETVYGSVNERNEWNGMFKKLQDGTADVALCDLSLTRERKDVADFSTKLSTGNLRIVYKIPDEKYHFRLYIIPFGWQIWILVTASIVVSGVLLYITSHFSPNSALHNTTDPIEVTKIKHEFSILDCLLAIYNGFNQQGSELEPKEVSGKIIFITVYLAFVIIFSSYTSVFTSFLTIRDTQKLFETLEDVYKDKSYSIGVTKDTSHEAIFKTETNRDSIEYKVWQRIEQNPKNLISNLKEGLNRAYSEKFAFLTPKESSTYYLGNNCSFDLSTEDIFSDSYHFAYRKGFPYGEAFNAFIDRMVEGGIVQRLNKKYQRDQINFCETDAVKPLGFKKVVSLYLLLAGASLFAAAALGVEWLFRLKDRSQHAPSTSALFKVKQTDPTPIKPYSSVKYPSSNPTSTMYKTYYFS